MKKTININLGGTPFIIDEDAYNLLTQYFDTLSHVYSNSIDSNEFLTDIEARVAELILMRIKSTQTIITLPMAEEVIAQIGHPQDFEEVEITPDSINVEQTIVPPPIPPQPEHITKRLFRNPNNKLLGGVCSGIAAYLNVDVTWVRLATVALCFLSFSTAALVYFLLWIIVPEAVTPLQQMQMRGETPTFGNIGRKVTGMFRTEEPNHLKYPQEEQPSGLGYNLSRFFAGMAKVLLVAIALICAPVLLAIIIAFVCLTIALIASMLGITSTLLPDFIATGDFNIMLLTCIGLTITFGIPISILVWLIATGSRRQMSPAWKRTLIIAWIIGFVLTVAGSFLCKVYSIREKYSNAIEKIQNTAAEESTEVTDSISIDSTEIKVDEEAQNASIVISKGENKKVVVTDSGVKIQKPGKKPIEIKK